jgi:hypothetical protein
MEKKKKASLLPYLEKKDISIDWMFLFNKYPKAGKYFFIMQNEENIRFSSTKTAGQLLAINYTQSYIFEDYRAILSFLKSSGLFFDMTRDNDGFYVIDCRNSAERLITKYIEEKSFAIIRLFENLFYLLETELIEKEKRL